MILMMKNIKISALIIALTGLFVLVSCEDFLSEQPTSFVDPNALLVNKEGAEIYTVGSYDAVRVLAPNFGGWMLDWGTLAADELVIPNWGADNKEIYLHSIAPTQTRVANLWESLYVSVNRVNSAVDRISAMTEEQIEPGVRDSLIGESRYLRAMLYFALVSSWENVPLVKNEITELTEENIHVPNATPQEVYDFIIEDLKYAENVLEIEQGEGRATKGAAQALLAKVYLQMTGFPLNQSDKFALAADKLEDVMSSGVYDLLDFYPDVFTLDGEQSDEIVFSIGFSGPGENQGGRLGTLFGPLGVPEKGGASGNNWYVNWELAGQETGLGNTGSWDETTGTGGKARSNHPYAQGYQEDDIRCRNNIAKHNVNKGDWYPEDGMYNYAARKEAIGAWKAWKWHNPRPSDWGTDTPLDAPYNRYADVLLMYAEAMNGQGLLTQEIADATINRIRARARVFPDGLVQPDDIAANLVVDTQDYNADEILSERRKELCFEGWRRNDLIRFGVYPEAISSSQPVWSNSGNPINQFEAHEIRWPIPDSELQLNPNLDQNPEYN